jgi:hypothetical protein
MTCSYGLFRSVNQSQVHDAGATTLELLFDLLDVTAQPLLQAFELWPIRIQANAEKAYSKFLLHLSRHACVAPELSRQVARDTILQYKIFIY